MTNIFVILVLAAVCSSNALENTQTSVSKSLVECYNDVNYYERDYKLPMTMDIFLNIIKKVEDSSYTMDLLQLSSSMLHRFRQDGIIQAVGLNIPGDMTGVLKFSPNGRQNDKFRVVLKYMVAPQGIFPNETLTRKERCSLHTMLSSSIEDWKRGDEEKVCPVLSRYQKRINKRFADKNNYMKIPNDVEIIQDSETHGKSGNIEAVPAKPKQNPKDVSLDVERLAKTKLPKSDCPVESGVISSRWGAVAVGPLLAGIAAAAQFQEIPLSKFNEDIKNDIKINNIWGATWAGDLAEAALYVNEDDDDDDKKISVGVAGGWNSTVSPHWYFLRKKTQLYMTDAEIRGGMDGLILGNLYKDEILNKYPSIKLSSLIGMYYSNAGLLGQYQACDRRGLYKKYATLDMMKKQAAAFAIALDKRVRLSISLEEEAIISLAEEAAKSLESYIPNNLNDVGCNQVTYAVGETNQLYTDIFISIDFNWGFQEIKDILSHMLTTTNLNKWNGNYTIINGLDGTVVTPSSNSLLDFYNIFDNITYYNSFQKGFNLNTAIRSIEMLASDQMRNESANGIGGGRSMTAVFIPFDEPEVTTYAVRRVKDFINIFLPDLRLFIVTKGNIEKYANLVKDQTKDVIQYIPSSGSNNNIPEKLTGLLEAIEGVPNRFINPKCEVEWSSSSAQDTTLDQYITPEKIRFYRIHPNYFFGDGSTTIKIKSLNPTDSLTVCFSRSNVNPRANRTSGSSGDVICDVVAGKEYGYTMNSPCADKAFIHDCPPLYFSVEAGETSLDKYFSCQDVNCPRTNDIKYQIIGNGLKCQSSGTMLVTNIFLLAIMLVFKIYI